MAGLLVQSRNENVRLNNENVQLKEVVKFQEEEIETIQAEHKAEMSAKDEEIASLRAELSSLYERCQCVTSERDEALSKLEQTAAEKAELATRCSQFEEALKDSDRQLSESVQERADVMAIVEIFKKKVFERSSEQTRLLDGEIILDGDSADSMSLTDIIKRVDKDADLLLKSDSYEITVAANGPTPAGNKRKTIVRQKGKSGQAKHKPRYTYSAEVLNSYGIDTSNLPAGSKFILRKGKKDTWVLRVVHYHKARTTCDEYEIGRFNVPGRDPMSSKLPLTILPGNPLMPSFVAFYITMKIGYGMPENRILDMIEKMNAHIPQSSLNNWIHQIVAYLRESMQPEMISRMKCAYYRQCDEVRILVRSRESKDAPFTYNNEYIHMHLSQDLKLVVMEYDEGSRSHEVQVPLFKDSLTRVFTADRAPLYTSIVNDLVEMALVRSADWVHARRCLVEAYLSDKRVKPLINIINALILIENEMGRKRYTPEQRFLHRLKHSRPLVDKFMKLLEKMRNMGREYGAMVHRAINYVLDDKEAFMVFLQYGVVEMHNNAAERMFRHLAMGRRNWLQSGSHEGAQNLAFLFSLYESCKLNDIDFETYIEDILTRIMNGDTDYASFIPCNYKPTGCDRQTDAVA